MSLGLCLKSTSSKLQRLLDTVSKIALFLVSGLKDKKLTKKQNYMKTEACKLYSRVFWIFLPNFIKIDPYNFELYPFKFGAFFETQCTKYPGHRQSELKTWRIGAEVYTVSQKKTSHFNFCHNFATCWAVFTIFEAFCSGIIHAWQIVAYIRKSLFMW